MLTVRQVYDFINEYAPFDTQEAFDNAGLLVGHPDTEVTGVLFAMDVTDKVLDEAEKLGVNLIVTHHPMMFAPRKRLVETDHEAAMLCRMIRSRTALISAHTNLDQAQGGVNDALAGRLGLQNVTMPDEAAYLRLGNLPCPMAAGEFAKLVSQRLSTVVRLMGPEDKVIRNVAVCSGSGSDYWQAARGADAFVTGEVRHHHALSAAAEGMVMLEAGHHSTEEPGIFALADALQKWENAVQYRMCIHKSQVGAY